MRIKRILSRSRRDLECEYICDFCGHEHVDYGYDDLNFHEEVIPNFKCPDCGKNGGKHKSSPKYEDSKVI